MFHDLPRDTQRCIMALFNKELNKQVEARRSAPDTDTFSRERCTDNIRNLSCHFARVLGGDQQKIITLDEITKMAEEDANDVLSMEDYRICAIQANSYFDVPETVDCGSRFTGVFYDIRDMFTNYLDQTANERLSESAAADRDHRDAYGDAA